MNRRNDDAVGEHRRNGGIGRRKFLAVGGALATTLVAGCSGGGTSEPSGTFRLYISDQPVAIDEFDSLEVTIDGARIFRADAESSDSTTGSDDSTATTTTDESESTEDTTTEDTTTEEPTTEETTTETDGGQDGYIDIDVDDETVDLTTVTGEKAIGVFDGEIPTGRYSSVHLSVSEVEGVVDGEAVDVKLPSERLKIVKPFEVTEDEPLEFVFDITVVKKGQSGGYNLLPVIGESGVVGQDVEMEEVEKSDEDGETETTTASDS